MTCKTLAAAAVALTALAGCTANKTEQNDMESKEQVIESAVQAENIDLAALMGEEKAAGRVEVYNLGDFKLHVYYTQDVMNDASYIVEGADSVVTMEEPLFKVNVAEFNKYLAKVGKPVARRISDYHVGGTASHEVLMAKGMPAFVKGPVYGGMMQGFLQTFGDSMAELPKGKEDEVDFGTAQVYAGVPFEFRHGASSDFPAASILIGGKAYYTHWTPAKAHMSHLQLVGRAAVDAEIAEAERELNSGAVLFIGGHGGAAQKDAVEFKIEYLKTIKSLLESAATAADFASALTAAYPNLPGADGVPALAEVMYK